MKVTANSLKIFLFKYRCWTCTITKDYIAVCIAKCSCECMYVCIYMCTCTYVCATQNTLVSCQKETFEQI